MAIRQSDADQKRLGILGDDELETIYGRPLFTHEDRCNYFFLSTSGNYDLRRNKIKTFGVNVGGY